MHSLSIHILSDAVYSPFQLQITASVRERPLRATLVLLLTPTWLVAAVHRSMLWLVTEMGFWVSTRSIVDEQCMNVKEKTRKKCSRIRCKSLITKLFSFWIWHASLWKMKERKKVLFLIEFKSWDTQKTTVEWKFRFLSLINISLIYIWVYWYLF